VARALVDLEADTRIGPHLACGSEAVNVLAVVHEVDPNDIWLIFARAGKSAQIRVPQSSVVNSLISIAALLEQAARTSSLCSSDSSANISS